MKLLLTFAASLLLLAGCSRPDPEPPPAAAVPASAQAEPAEPAAHTYRCASGETLIATYNAMESVTLQYQGTSHRLPIAPSGSGSRYAGDGLEWWIKGQAGTLSRLADDGSAGQPLQECQTTD